MPDVPNEAPRQKSDAGSQPPVLIPVTAEDFARQKRRKILILCAATLAVLGAAAYIYKRAVDPLHAQESYDSAVRLMKIARYEQAILACDRAVMLKPDLVDAYLLRARAYMALSNPDKAIAEFTKALGLRRDPQALMERGLANLELKNFQAARSDADQAIALDPKLAAAYNLRGLAIRAMGDPQKALPDFDRAVVLAPNADNYFQRGATYQMIGDHRRAIADFDQVIAFNPDGASAYFARSQSRKLIGDLAGARADRRQGTLLDAR